MRHVPEKPERESRRRTKPANKRALDAETVRDLERVVKEYGAKRRTRTDTPAKLTPLQRRMQSGEF